MQKKIKLVSSDIDGTLVSEGTTDLNPKVLEMVRKLKSRGIIFVAASGRQFDGMLRLFQEVSDDMIFISNNGAYISCRDTKMFEAIMKRTDVEQLIPFIRNQKDCCFTASTGTDGSYVEESAPKEFIDLLVNGYGNKVTLVPDILNLDLPIIKVAMYRKEGIQEISEDIKKEWEERFHVLEAGTCWVDFVDHKADKGIALASIQKALSISKDETMAFGDNLNDLGMLRTAGHSYAVGGARPEVKTLARYITDTVEENGVLQVLEKLI